LTNFAQLTLIGNYLMALSGIGSTHFSVIGTYLWI